jgi:hypothetical protein
MQRIDGVQKVRVSLESGLTVLDLEPNNNVTLARLRQIIKNNGFVSKEAQVTAAGESVIVDGKPEFTVKGTGERLPAVTQPVRTNDAWMFTVPAPR